MFRILTSCTCYTFLKRSFFNEKGFNVLTATYYCFIDKMSHCDYDTIFYRVFCATVLGIAFTFTVILTNVFIDIDGLLSNKG